jgi:phospholipid/cholesterol/gamma-HCH transport system substrate-binding protein
VIIAPESLFGDWQAEISTLTRFPGFAYYHIPADERQRDTLVLPGYALPDISRLTAAADEISKNLATLTDRFDRAFSEETAENLRLTISNIQGVSEDIRNLIGQQAETFERVAGQVEGAAMEIGGASTAARSTLERIDQTLRRGEVDSILVNVRAATANINEMTREVNASTGQLRSTLASADSAFARINRITGDVEAGRGNLGLLLNDTTLVARAENVLMQFEVLLADIRANPRKYVRFSIF